MSYLHDIVSDIEKGSCVLVLGPDLQEYDGKSFFEAFCADLTSNTAINDMIDLSPQHIFEHEELLQLKPNAKETSVLRAMERFYQKQNQLNDPFSKISQIPFHLIVSLLPDSRLKTIFEAQNLPFQSSHYPREENPKAVEKPEKNKPLIYNLLGDFNEEDAIFTFDHLFTYLSGIMGKRELPDNLQEMLKKARSFIFLGVHFEKWYVQLLLRIITTKSKKDKYTLLKNTSDNSAYTFIARRLELDFIETEPVEFLNQLYNQCGEEKMLKTVNTSIKARIFISYNHKDKGVVLEIEKKLQSANIEVIRDEMSMAGGQKIDDFISIVKNVDCVLSVISENSLKSKWVSKEIMRTINDTNTYYLPCYLDESFLDKNFIYKTNDLVDGKLDDIMKKMGERGRSPIDDLMVERNDWMEFSTNLPKILHELSRRKCISIQTEDFQKNIIIVIEDIIKNKK